MQVDTFLFLGLIITRNDKILPASPSGISIGNQYVAVYLATLNVM